MNALRAILKWVRESSVRTILIVVLIVLLAVFMGVGFSDPARVYDFCDPAQVYGLSDPAWVYRFFGVETGMEKSRILEFIGVIMGGVLLAIGAVSANRRAVAMEKAASAQVEANEGAEDGRRQERMKNAIEHLGHKSASVRLGGAYELFHLARDTEHLARDTEDLGQTVMNILCAHIRWTTGKGGYQKKHRSKPSEEVQNLLTLLFRQKHEVFTDRHIGLQESWLNGAILDRARLQGANLAGARLQGASLRVARLQGAHLGRARLQGTNLAGARLQGARLRKACLQGTNLGRTRLQGANLARARLQGARLREAQLQGANLTGAQLQGATCQRRSYVSLSLKERIRERIDQESDLSKAIFSGGLSREGVDSLVQDLPDKEAERRLRKKLEPHVGKPASNELPQRSGAIVRAYTKEEAERWIAEYAEAMGEV